MGRVIGTDNPATERENSGRMERWDDGKSKEAVVEDEC